MVIVAAALASGCAESLTRTSVAVPTLEARAEPAIVSRAGVEITVQPLGYGELAAGKVPTLQATWEEIDPTRPSDSLGGGVGTPLTRTRQAALQLLPLPSFALAIVNGSAAPLDFGRAKIALTTKTGKRYAALLLAEEVAARVELVNRRRYPGTTQRAPLLAALREAVLRQPLLTTSTRIGAGQRWKGLLVIDLAAYDLQEVAKVLADEDELLLRFEELGGEATAASLGIRIERRTTTIAARCPSGAPPVAQSCRLPD